MSKQKTTSLDGRGEEGYKPDMKDISWSTPSVQRSVIVHAGPDFERLGFSREQVLAIRKACHGK